MGLGEIFVVHVLGVVVCDVFQEKVGEDGDDNVALVGVVSAEVHHLVEVVFAEIHHLVDVVSAEVHHLVGVVLAEVHHLVGLDLAEIHLLGFHH